MEATQKVFSDFNHYYTRLLVLKKSSHLTL